MKNVLLAVVAVAMGGCATLRADSANKACADDLVKRGYYDDNSNIAHKQAELNCSQFTPDEIKTATELFDAHYAGSNENLAMIMKEVHNQTPEAVSCAKQKWDATPADERLRFRVDPNCTMTAMAPAPAASSAPVIANNAFDVLTQAGTATTYLHLVEVAGFTDTLKSKEGITVFAISDAAFAKEKPEYADWIATNNADNLKRFVTNSVAAGVYPSASIKGRAEATSIGTHVYKLELKKKKKVLTVDTFPVAGNKELTAGNGLVYIVDGNLADWMF